MQWAYDRPAFFRTGITVCIAKHFVYNNYVKSTLLQIPLCAETIICNRVLFYFTRPTHQSAVKGGIMPNWTTNHVTAPADVIKKYISKNEEEGLISH